MIKVLKEKIDSQYEWIDISEPEKEELNEVAKQYNLHYTLVKDSLQAEHLPKYEMVNDIQFIILRIYDTESGKESDSIQEVTNKIAIFIGADFIITIHRASYQFLRDIKVNFVNPGKCSKTYDILYHIISSAFNSYEVPANKLVEELDFYEEKIFLKSKVPSLLKNLYLIKRKATVINRVLALSKPILDNLENKMPPPFMQDLRDSLVKVKINAEQTVENVSNLLNIYISLSSQKTNEVMRVLTLISVFFMPLTFIVGVYGMNFQYMPELSSKIGYPAVWMLMLMVTLSIYMWFKRKGWL